MTSPTSASSAAASGSPRVRPPPSPRPRLLRDEVRPMLGSILVQKGWITHERLDAALAEVRSPACASARLFCPGLALRARARVRAGGAVRTRYVDLVRHPLDPRAAALLPIEVRFETDDDVVPLSEFLNACTLVHQGVSRSSPADIVARLHLGSADPRLDSFVAVSDGAIVGFAHLWADGPDEVKLFARTHPDARGRGIGTRLLSLCDRRAAEFLPGAQRTTTTWAADAAARRCSRPRATGRFATS